VLGVILDKILAILELVLKSSIPALEVQSAIFPK
jgi:hypothetical protein